MLSTHTPRCEVRGVTVALTAPLVLIIAVVSALDARPHRVAQIPNGQVNSCANCHINPGGGGTRNAFGQSVEGSFLSGGNVVWGAALAQLDADGDGVANGAELQDPGGSWTVGQAAPGSTSLVTNPGIAASSSSPPAEDPPSTTTPPAPEPKPPPQVSVSTA